MFDPLGQSRMADSPDLGGDVTGKCTFQFWVDRVESFYCKLDECRWNFGDSPGELSKNVPACTELWHAEADQ